MADPGARPIGEYLKEGETECLSDGLGDLLAQAIRPARVTARNIGNRVGGSIAAELTDKAGQQFGSVVDQPAVEF
jgi:hypothetical protein